MSHDDTNDDSNDSRGTTKEFRLAYPTGWLRLTQHRGVQLIIDAFIDAGPSREFNKSELAEFAGVSRQTVQNRIGLLVDLDIVSEVETASTTRYRLDVDSPVTQTILDLNYEVNAVLSDEEEKKEAQSDDKATDTVPTPTSFRINTPGEIRAAITLLQKENSPQHREILDELVAISNRNPERLTEYLSSLEPIVVDHPEYVPKLLKLVNNVSEVAPAEVPRTLLQRLLAKDLDAAEGSDKYADAEDDQY